MPAAPVPDVMHQALAELLDDMRIGAALRHVSDQGAGRCNPGSETVTPLLALPLPCRCSHFSRRPDSRITRQK
jgi:hypothetical protein